MRKIRPVRIRISVYEYDIDPSRRVGMSEAGMRVPIDASDFFGIELHFLVERSAQRMEHGAFDRASHVSSVATQ